MCVRCLWIVFILLMALSLSMYEHVLNTYIKLYIKLYVDICLIIYIHVCYYVTMCKPMHICHIKRCNTTPWLYVRCLVCVLCLLVCMCRAYLSLCCVFFFFYYEKNDGVLYLCFLLCVLMVLFVFCLSVHCLCAVWVCACFVPVFAGLIVVVIFVCVVRFVVVVFFLLCVNVFACVCVS